MERVLTSDADALRRATSTLDAGELCVIPTDARYVVCADALVDDAVQRVLDVKGRGADMGVPVCVSGIEDAHHVAHITPLARTLAARVWPGALTLVLRAKAWLPDEVTGGSGTVAVRCPALAFDRDLARHFGPFVMTGANRHGAPRATRADEAIAQLGGAVSLYVDGGATQGASSTIVDATGREAKVLREGAVSAAELAADGPRGD